MEKDVSFKIYDASAGSGKTFTLVKGYLARVLESKSEGYYQHLLAITFTNKAVAEMKQRILNNLISFSDPKVIADPSEMFLQISKELNIQPSQIHRRSNKVLKHILHNYATFSVETIDKFNHKLIRTFARDLKLTSNFEVSLDAPQLLLEAVDQLLSKIGEDAKITQVLLDFALEKTDDDRSWDISKDIAQASNLLFKENDAAHLAKLKEKTFDDFAGFKKQLLVQKKTLSEKIQKIATKTLELIAESGLEQEDFSSGFLPKHFQNLNAGRFNINFKAKWQETLGEKPLYPKRAELQIASIIDELTPVFIDNFNNTKIATYELLLIDSILKNLTPLFVINLVSQELETIKEEKNLLPISEFNALINSEIKDQPAPFIYERLGEKYRHFFIDEFQDTSLLQWENLKPLIHNALSQLDASGKPGSLLLVGDAKQSIYRWRGGLPEQFIGLSGDLNPFVASEKTTINLETNYRSCEKIIDFNNQFFSFAAKYFGNDVYKKLYETGNHQKANHKKGGYVKFEFIEKHIKSEKNEIYAQYVHKTITNLKSRGFKEKDICILTRNKKDGIYLGEYLMTVGVPVISSETLMLKSSTLVQCLVHTLELSTYPENNEAKIYLLDFLHNHLSITESKHTFFSNFLDTTVDSFETQLKKYDLDFSLIHLRSVSLYEGCEYIIRQLRLQDKADAYLFSFMDLIFEFENSPKVNKSNFLETWELQKDKLSIPSNDSVNAVQLMTIHKAKGLEFPVVLFPFADIEIYKTKMDTLWYPLEEKLGYDFEEAPIHYKNELAHYSEVGTMLYTEHRNTLELDNLNLLYVTLTRAIEELHVFAETPSLLKDGNPKNYNQLFGEFLKSSGKWADEQKIYEFGVASKSLGGDSELKSEQSTPLYIATPPEVHNLKIITSESSLWETEAQSAIDQGNLLHDIMAEVKRKEDIEFIFDTLKDRALYASEEIEKLKIKVLSITNHPELEHFFSASAIVKNEKDIITASGMLLRPDRLNFHSSNSVTIIDYKTGVPNYHHEDQINYYATALQEMGKIVSEKILVYTNEAEIVINKV